MIGTVNLMTTCVLVAQMVQLFSCSCEGATKELMSHEPRFLDFLAAARNCKGNLQRKTIAKCTSTQMWYLGRLGIATSSTQFLEEKDFIDKMGVYDVVPRSNAAEKGCRVIRTRWVTVNKGSDDA